MPSTPGGPPRAPWPARPLGHRAAACCRIRPEPATWPASSVGKTQATWMTSGSQSDRKVAGRRGEVRGRALCRRRVVQAEHCQGNRLWPSHVGPVAAAASRPVQASREGVPPSTHGGGSQSRDAAGAAEPSARARVVATATPTDPEATPCPTPGPKQSLPAQRRVRPGPRPLDSPGPSKERAWSRVLACR